MGAANGCLRVRPRMVHATYSDDDEGDDQKDGSESPSSKWSKSVSDSLAATSEQTTWGLTASLTAPTASVHDDQENTRGSSELDQYPSSGSLPSIPRRFGQMRPLPPIPIQPGQEEKILVALFDHTSGSGTDLTIVKGEHLLLEEDCAEEDAEWIYVKHMTTGVTGYVPKSHVANIRAMEKEEWYAGVMDRRRAEMEVMRDGLPRGTFLVRKRERSEGNGLDFALTIRDGGHKRSMAHAKHYRIKIDEHHNFYISKRRTFGTLQDLCIFYSTHADGLCYRLIFPAPKIAPLVLPMGVTKDNFEIRKHELEFYERIGSGFFGEVFFGKWRNSVTVAIKMVKTNTMTPDSFLTEARIMKRCDHPNLVKLFAVCSTEPLLIVTEYMENKSLYMFLKTPLGGALTLKSLTDMAAQVANGMSYLENKDPAPIVHRDLAARNVLVGEIIAGVPVVKVCDFGLARALKEEEDDSGVFIYETVNTKFPIKWTAPEAGLGKKWTTKSDVWSYGVLLYELFTKGKEKLYKELDPPNNKDVLQEVSKGYRMSKPDCVPEAVYVQMLLCWHKEPSLRPSFQALYEYFLDYIISSQAQYEDAPFE